MSLENPISGFPNSQTEKEFKPWTCGEPFQFPLEDILEGIPNAGSKDGLDGASKTKDSSDPWSFVLEYFATREKARCDAWKDEVQNLLVFSGLFSAVVTAFLVESYTQLQEDTGAVTVALLSQLVSLANTSESSSTSPPVVPFSPTSSNIRINIFWFLSLVFSLATAIIGIVSTQWAREHQRPAHGLSPRQEAALLHMNAEAIKRYYIPQIFSMLPLLLLIGLVLFLAGLVDFLWHLNHVVGIPILAVVTITLTFLLISTVLPGLQPLPIHPSVNGNLRPPVLCSYKSPQSWAFLQLMGLVKHFFKWRLFYLRGTLFRFADNHKPFIKKHFGSRRRFKQKLSWLTESFSADLRANWHDHGLSWLHQRDIHSISTVSSDEYLASYFVTSPYCFLPQHDSLQALVHIQKNLSRVRSAAFLTLCKCFEDLSKFSFQNEAHTSPHLAAHLNRVLHGHYDYRSFIPRDVLEECKSDSQLLVDVARLRFATRDEDSFLPLHYAELSIRITKYLLSRRPAVWTVDVGFAPVDPMEFLADSFVPYRSLPSSIKMVIFPQVQHLVLQVFDHVADPSLLQDSHQKHYIISEPMKHILEYGAQILIHDPEGTLRRTNDVIFTKTIEGLDNSSGAEADHLFALASIYVLDLLNADLSNWKSTLSESLVDIRAALQRYKIGADARGVPDAAWMKESLHWHEYDWCRVLGRSTSGSEIVLDKTSADQFVPAVPLTANQAQIVVEDLARPLTKANASERSPPDGGMLHAPRNVGPALLGGDPALEDEVRQSGTDNHIASSEAVTSTNIINIGEMEGNVDMERVGHLTIHVGLEA